MNAKKIFTYHAYSKLPVKININKTIDDQVINDGKYFFLIGIVITSSSASQASSLDAS